MRRIIVGVVGPGKEATAESMRDAFELGVLIAGEGWVLLTGGRNCGVMNSVNKGAKQGNGLTVGILPNDDHSLTSASVDIRILSGMGQARNNINALSSDLLFACGIGPGTASEIALAVKANKSVILINFDETSAAFFRKLGGRLILFAESPESAIQLARNLLDQNPEVSVMKSASD